ncbi:MAG: penicillin-insensitive murein endopeptidase [Rhodospirillaceae bacterium]
MKIPLSVLAVAWLAAWPFGAGAPVSAASNASDAARDAGERSSRDSPAALLSLSDEELARRVELDATSVGSLSIGSPGSAMLINPVALEPGPYWTIADRAEVYGTSETLEGIETAITKVHELYPDAPPIIVGDISDEDGGRLKRHQSHQGGRDADLGFFFKGGAAAQLLTGTAANLDLAKNWALVRALATCTDVETILLDIRIQRLLYKYALSIGEDQAWLDRVFYFTRGSKSAIVKHVVGHRNHYHVRFYNPVAQELGRRVHPILVELKLVDPPVYTVRHVVRPGQTMGQLAARYGTSVRAIKSANGLSSTALRAGRAYRIPVKTAAPASAPLVVPFRRLPPSTPEVLASASWPTVESLYAGSGSLPFENPALLAHAAQIF